MIDLNDPTHVEALRWACRDAANEQCAHHEFGPGFGYAPEPGSLNAIVRDAITDPALAADVLRQLLERRGVHVLAIHGEEFQEERGEVAWVVDDERSTPELGACWIDQLPDRVLAMIDAPDRVAALAALRGER